MMPLIPMAKAQSVWFFMLAGCFAKASALDVKASALTTCGPMVWAMLTASIQLYCVSCGSIPELAHGNVGDRTEVDVARWIHVVGLVRVEQAMLVRHLLDLARVFLQHQFL